MNLCLLLWLMPFLATGNGDGVGIHNMEVSTVEVPTDDEFNSGPKKYSTGVDNNPFLLDDDDGDDSFLGTTFFQGPRRQCFTSHDIALMSARQGFEQLVPKSYPKYLSGNGIALLLVRYWNVVIQIVNYMSDKETERLLEDAFYDTLGAYLSYYLMPVARVSFYAGHVTLNTVEHLLNIKRECHDVLKTNGNGWRLPAFKNITEQLRGMTIEPAKLGIETDRSRITDDGSNICDHLDLSDISEESNKGQMLLPLPELEPVDVNGHLTNIYLPFRGDRVYNLRSSRSASELKRYLDTIMGCEKYLQINPARYNHKLLAWMQEFVPQHLADDQFYPGLGGILQIQESLLKAVQAEPKMELNSGKQGRSTSLWKGNNGEQEPENPYMNGRLYVAASIVLTVVFLTVVFLLHCGRLFAKKEEGKPPLQPEDVELAEVYTMPKPKRVKKERKPKFEPKIETPTSPLRAANERGYYGQLARSGSSDECSTSTLGYQFKEKIMPFRFDIPLGKGRKTYKYSSLSSQETDCTSSSEIQYKRKKPGRGK
ncbi:hypothetical protein KR059_005646 [Drosophila kikkawai]|nr:hypothetical protein KR059_005646 [Drosophila kikkawai]